jgi:hypothetical protein
MPSGLPSNTVTGEVSVSIAAFDEGRSPKRSCDGTMAREFARNGLVRLSAGSSAVTSLAAVGQTDHNATMSPWSVGYFWFGFFTREGQRAGGFM